MYVCTSYFITSTGIKRGSWVRLKRSMYKDDIAQVGVVIATYNVEPIFESLNLIYW